MKESSFVPYLFDLRGGIVNRLRATPYVGTFRGIPVPSRSTSVFRLEADSISSFGHKLFIADRDGIVYKIEAAGEWLASPQECGGTEGLKSQELDRPATKELSFESSSLACPMCAPSGIQHQVNTSTGCRQLLKGTRGLKYVHPTQLLIYVSYPYCDEVWDSGASGTHFSFQCPNKPPKHARHKSCFQRMVISCCLPRL